MTNVTLFGPKNGIGSTLPHDVRKEKKRNKQIKNRNVVVFKAL